MPFSDAGDGRMTDRMLPRERLGFRCGATVRPGANTTHDRGFNTADMLLLCALAAALVTDVLLAFFAFSFWV